MAEATPGCRARRLLFCSSHCYLDPSSGAALSVRDLFTLLSAVGWQSAALCGAEGDKKPAISRLSRRFAALESFAGDAGPAVHLAELFEMMPCAPRRRKYRQTPRSM
jgi:hypothetical protein